MSVTCGRARRILWPDASPRSATWDIVEAQGHVSHCSDCRQFLAEMTATATLVHRAAPLPPAPSNVRERLFFVIAQSRLGPSPRRRSPWWRAAVAALAVLALGWWHLGPGRLSPSPLAAIMEDHERIAGRTAVPVSDPAAATRWLRDRVPFAVQLPAFPGATMEEARLLRWADVRGAVVEYRVGGRELSYYMISTGADDSGATLGELQVARRPGYQVLTWRENGIVHGLVADLPESTLRGLALLCMRQMRAAGRPA